MRRSGYIILSIASLFIGHVGYFAVAQDTLPTSTPNVDSRLDPIRFNAPDLTGEGRPTRGNTETATRGGFCDISGKELTPLVPSSHIGWTDATRPTFWFSIPFDAEEFDTLKFTLIEIREDGAIATVHEKMVKAPTTLPGIIGISIPQSAPELEVGRTYDWSLDLYCIDPMADVLGGQPNATISGSIVRREVPADLERDLEAATTPRERAIAYAKHGFWYDTLTIIADLNRNNPDDPTFANDWKSLLSDVELDDIASQPIIECCFVEEEP